MTTWRFTLGLAAFYIAIAAVTALLAGGSLVSTVVVACSGLCGIIFAFAAGSRYEREAARGSERSSLADRILLGATDRRDVTQ